MEREQRDDARRRRLAEAGLELFGTAGYANAPIEALCVEASVATRSFYELFGSREALLRTIYDDIIGAIAVDMAASLTNAGLEPVDRIRAAVSSYLEPLVEDPRKGRVTQLEVVGVGDLEAHRREVIRRFAATIAAAIEQWMAEGQVAQQELGLLPLIMAGGVSEALVDHLLHPDEQTTLSALIDEITRVWTVILRLPR